MSSSRNTKYIGVKAVLQLESCMQANRLDGYTSTWFLMFLICLQCSHNNFRRSDVLRDVSYEPEKTREFFMIVVRYTKRNKKLIVGGEYIIFFYDKL